VDDTRLEEVKQLHVQLKKISGQWAAKQPVDLEKAAAIRRQILLLNHKRYFDLIPIYRKLALDVQAPDNPDLDFIARELISTDDIFKSYDPQYLDAGDFGSMTRWLETLFAGEIEIKTSDIHTISEWIGRLAENQVYSTFSSGTIGRLSFVPRDSYNWDNFLNASASYIPYLFVGLNVATTNFDAISLSFRTGNMGVGLVGQRISKSATNAYFLYEAELSPDVLRMMRKGPANDDEKKALEAYRNVILSKADESYDRIIGNIVDSLKEPGRSLKVFGAPYQVKQLCERMVAKTKTVRVPPGSTLSFGGGWKTFEGDKIDRAKLIELIQEALGIDRKYIFEGFAMTEMNVSFMRCSEDKYHVPPLIEPVIYDQALLPIKGRTVTGTFGYLDPFATSYPGFIISGDVVTMTHDLCECGREGPTIVGEVTRAPGREVKGCGGIMGAMKA
jgi:hypothetical protein